MTVGSAAVIAPRSFENCDPLPINASAEGYKGKRTSKMTPILLAKTIEKRLRQLVDKTVELHFGFCFQQKC
jgi:hypothetical protein